MAIVDSLIFTPAWFLHAESMAAEILGSWLILAKTKKVGWIDSMQQITMLNAPNRPNALNYIDLQPPFPNVTIARYQFNIETSRFTVGSFGPAPAAIKDLFESLVATHSVLQATITDNWLPFQLCGMNDKLYAVLQPGIVNPYRESGAEQWTLLIWDPQMTDICIMEPLAGNNFQIKDVCMWEPVLPRRSMIFLGCGRKATGDRSAHIVVVEYMACLLIIYILRLQIDHFFFSDILALRGRNKPIATKSISIR